MIKHITERIKGRALLGASISCSLFMMISCGEDARSHADEESDPRSGANHNRTERSSSSRSDRTNRRFFIEPPLSSNLELSGPEGSSYSELLEHYMSDVPDSKKADYMISLASAAGLNGDTEFLSKLLELNPGEIKNLGIQSYAENAIGIEAIRLLFNLVPADVFPEEQEALWKGASRGIIDLPSEDLSALIKEGTIPPGLEMRAAHLLGINLSGRQPEEARLIMEEYSSEMREAIESSYWISFVVSNPQAARAEYEAGRVPRSSWVVVGREVVNSIIHQDSFERALQYVQAREHAEQQEALANHVFASWVYSDSIAASERASLLPPGPALNGAARAIALRMEQLKEHESAERWREIIQPE